MSGSHDADRSEENSLDGWFDASRAVTVVEKVAEVTGQSPLEMDPLGEMIDPDALDRLSDSRSGRSSSVRVTFDYSGHRITTTADSIQVEPSPPAEE